MSSRTPPRPKLCDPRPARTRATDSGEIDPGYRPVSRMSAMPSSDIAPEERRSESAMWQGFEGGGRIMHPPRMDSVVFLAAADIGPPAPSG